MKTFNENDLITWFNRDQAEVGKEYYFANSISEMEEQVNNGKYKFKLHSIDENRVDQTFQCDDRTCFCWACILPVDAVKETEKKYSPFKNFQELFKLVNDMNDSRLAYSENECIYELIHDCVLHLKSKQSGAEYFTAIRSICKNESLEILINSSFTFEELFNEFEIEINGEWKPFGMQD